MTNDKMLSVDYYFKPIIVLNTIIFLMIYGEIYRVIIINY